MRYYIICFLTIVYFVGGMPEYLSTSSLLNRALCYQFFHGNILHLIVNCLAVYALFRKDYDPKYKWELLFGYVVSCLVYPLSLVPVIGVSNILFAVMGLRTPPFSNAWWKTTEVKVFLGFTLGLLFISNVAAFTHIVSFLIGVAIANTRRWISLQK